MSRWGWLSGLGREQGRMSGERDDKNGGRVGMVTLKWIAEFQPVWFLLVWWMG